MIALLSCSISSSASDGDNLPTGELRNRVDSIPISFNDLRIVNSKLIELNYQKDINSNLNKIIDNQNIVINDYSKLNKKLNEDCKKYIKQRNITIGVCSGVVAAIITSLILIAK